MNETICLHCSHPLADAEMEAGWCDSCGKKVPQHLVSAAAARRAAAARIVEAGGKKKGRRKANPLAILVIFAFLLVGTVVGGLVGTRLSGEPGMLSGGTVKGGACGILLGGVVGVWASSALGMMGKSGDED